MLTLDSLRVLQPCRRGVTNRAIIFGSLRRCNPAPCTAPKLLGLVHDPDVKTEVLLAGHRNGEPQLFKPLHQAVEEPQLQLTFFALILRCVCRPFSLTLPMGNERNNARRDKVLCATGSFSIETRISNSRDPPRTSDAKPSQSPPGPANRSITGIPIFFSIEFISHSGGTQNHADLGCLHRQRLLRIAKTPCNWAYPHVTYDVNAPNAI